MLKRIISGGQTGSDEAAWRAAKSASLPTGGWMPRGFLTEAGKRPEFAGLYGAVETDSATYPPRTRLNVENSDATLWFGDVATPGAMATMNACRIACKPFRVVESGTRPSEVAEWIVEQRIAVLNVAGNRESKSPGIGTRVERFMAVSFKRLAIG